MKNIERHFDLIAESIACYVHNDVDKKALNCNHYCHECKARAEEWLLQEADDVDNR